MTSLYEFLEAEKLIYSPIYYFIDENSSKKTPIGEKNNATIEEINALKEKRKNYFPPPTEKNSKKVNGAWVGTPLSEVETSSLKKAFSVYVKHTINLYVVDVDDPEIKSMDDFIYKTGVNIFKNCCWVQGNTKGIHIYLKINNMVKISDQQNVYVDFCGDLIKTNNSWERTDKKVYNYTNGLKEFEYEEIKEIFNEKYNKPKIKPKIESEYEPETEIKTETETESASVSNLTMLQKMLPLYSPTRIQDQDMWLNFTIAIKETFGNEGKQIWREISKLHGEKPQANKPNGNYDENANDDIWCGLKTKKKNELGFGSLVKWARDDSPEKYEKLFGKPIDWITFTSEAGFAKTMKDVIFKDKKIIFTGKDKQPRGYLYDGIIWRELSLSKNEIKQKNFDTLYNYYINMLQKNAKKMEESAYKYYYGQIQSLNKRLTRENVIKLFITDCYLAKEPKWNNNPDIFAFDDKLFDLKTKQFLKDAEIKPEWYINHTCGYDFDYKEYDEIKVKEAKNKIITLFSEILSKEDVNYFMKTIASFMKQSNPEERAYFWLGNGGNGKGTVTELLKLVLGEYFGELKMSNYTEKDQGKDAPNQNLFNNKYSRVMNSSEIDDKGENSLRFRSDFFKMMSGGDAIQARALGKSEIAEFQAGKILIQTNKMPSFTIIDAGLRRRIIVIEFPYSFTDDLAKINKNPEKFKKKDTTLKQLFKTNEYRRAMIEILMENYNDEAIEIPISVKKYTQSYFDEESISAWVLQNYRLATEEEIEIYKKNHPRTIPSTPLNVIKSEYEFEKGKKLSIKIIIEQLQEEGLKIKGGNSAKSLQGYVSNKNDNENNEESDEENI